MQIFGQNLWTDTDPQFQDVHISEPYTVNPNPSPNINTNPNPNSHPNRWHKS